MDLTGEIAKIKIESRNALFQGRSARFEVWIFDEADNVVGFTKFRNGSEEKVRIFLEKKGGAWAQYRVEGLKYYMEAK